MKEGSSVLRFEYRPDEPIHQRSAPGKGDPGEAAPLQVMDRRLANPDEVGRVRFGIPGKGLPMCSEGAPLALLGLNQSAPIDRIELRHSEGVVRLVISLRESYTGLRGEADGQPQALRGACLGTFGVMPVCIRPSGSRRDDTEQRAHRGTRGSEHSTGTDFPRGH